MSMEFELKRLVPVTGQDISRSRRLGHILKVKLTLVML